MRVFSFSGPTVAIFVKTSLGFLANLKYSIYIFFFNWHSTLPEVTLFSVDQATFTGPSPLKGLALESDELGPQVH